jgi:L-cysteine/cystine lyase
VTFEEARAAFPVLERVAHLNAGSVGPIARATVEAMAVQEQADLEQGRGGIAYIRAMLEARDRVRGQIAALIGAGPQNVALAYSTSNACNIVLAGLDLGPEDEVVTTDVEHFGLLGPLHASGARVRVAAVRDLPAQGALDAILEEVGPRTRLLALSHVAWTTGNVLPAAELKAQTGLPILVDGAQSVGAIPVDVTAFDYYTISGQKWLCGPDATGALYVAEPEALRVALPTYFSQTAYQPDGAFEAKEGAARFNSGAIPRPLLAGLEAALAGAPDWRFERARQTAEHCRERLAERYEVVTEPGQATLVTFRPGGDAAEIAARLYDRGVLVRDMPHTPWLRVSVGYWTSEGDIERLLATLELDSK